MAGLKPFGYSVMFRPKNAGSNQEKIKNTLRIFEPQNGKKLRIMRLSKKLAILIK